MITGNYGNKISSGICNMICERFNQGIHFWNKRGLKFCARCRIAVIPIYRNCPCCHTMLRVKTHKPKQKEFEGY